MPTALLMIDIQMDYFLGGSMPLADPDAAAGEAKRLLDAFRAHQWPVIFLKHISDRPGATFFLPDTHGIEIHPLVAPSSEETVLVKHFPNSFRATELQDVLQRHKVDSLVIAGMMTHMCVDATTRQAVDLGYTCQVASDATATRDLRFAGNEVLATDVQTSFLAALNGTYAKVHASTSVLASLFSEPAPPAD